MHSEIDILEDELLKQYPDVLEILLFDNTTQKNIFWATDNYNEFGKNYEYSSCIEISSISGKFGNIIMPRVKKKKDLQQSRIRKMAEVYTPAWICNSQNNLIDNVWFNKENVFNIELKNKDGSSIWKVNKRKIKFPKGKTWLDYVKDKRLEISCGEAPYITSRYDTTTGDFIPVENRIGLLDRKLRVINENTNESSEWLNAVQIAYKNIYAFEWQGDSLLLARESMLKTFIENYKWKFGKEPQLKSIKTIANIIAWNVWQMDGIRFVIPNSCKSIPTKSKNLFGEIEIKNIECDGCANELYNKHNGIYCIIKDWSKKDNETNKMGKKIKFIELINQ